jgi:uncharacterized alkaline shock family protein YloU
VTTAGVPQLTGTAHMPATGTPSDADSTAGKIVISDTAVAKIASRAVLEVRDVGGATPRLLGRTMPLAGHLGIRTTSLTTPPKASADVDGTLVYLDLRIGVRWPASLPQVTAQVRDHLRARVPTLTGLTVAEVHITVDALITDTGPASRTR